MGPDQVYVDVTHSSLCATDQLYTKAPQVLRHEGVGIVREIGSEVMPVKVGDRVGMHYRQEICGECRDCNTGMAITIQYLTLSFFIAETLFMMGPVLSGKTRLC